MAFSSDCTNMYKNHRRWPLIALACAIMLSVGAWQLWSRDDASSLQSPKAVSKSGTHGGAEHHSARPLATREVSSASNTIEWVVPGGNYFELRAFAKQGFNPEHADLFSVTDERWEDIQEVKSWLCGPGDDSDFGQNVNTCVIEHAQNFGDGDGCAWTTGIVVERTTQGKARVILTTTSIREKDISPHCTAYSECVMKAWENREVDVRIPPEHTQRALWIESCAHIQDDYVGKSGDQLRQSAIRVRDRYQEALEQIAKMNNSDGSTIQDRIQRHNSLGLVLQIEMADAIAKRLE